MGNLLEIKDLFVDYKTDEGDVHALNGFSISIRKGEKRYGSNSFTRAEGGDDS